MSNSQPDIAVVGLGVMGASLARNFHSRGLTVVGYNRSADLSDPFFARYGDARFVRIDDLEALPAAFGDQPARIVLMVTAGKAVDAVLDALVPHLRPGDVVIDGGNSHYADTDRRMARGRAEGFRFVGMGVSGGERGALEGPSMMPGGDAEAWPLIEGLMRPAAAVSDTGPCVTWCGNGSAGHFVKMVHNGIEYGDMQLIAETWSLLSEGLQWDAPRIGATFAAWNAGELESFLVEITAGIVATRDPQGDGPLVDAILDVAGQKGTGRWTAIAATELGVPVPTISAAVDARAMSARKAWRVTASERGLSDLATQPLTGVTADDLARALYVAKLMSYTQGFHLLAEASAARDYGTDLAAVARIWKAGCIIRARFLDRVYEAFHAQPDLPLLFLAPSFAAELKPRIGALRTVVAAATAAGLPIPALSASLAYFDTMTRAVGSARLIQAQRDWFGAHTYRRQDDPETAVHSDWDALPRLT
jgi:6-phosphogluconate dehydrogenase